MNVIPRKGYCTNSKAPINDLVEFYNQTHKKGKIEVRMSHKTTQGPDDDNWEHTDLVATFNNYDYAKQFAQDFANHLYVWCGGVLIR